MIQFKYISSLLGRVKYIFIIIVIPTLLSAVGQQLAFLIVFRERLWQM